MEEFFEKGTLPQEDLRARPAPGGAARASSSRCCPPRRCATSACTRCWTRSSTCCPRPPTAARSTGTDPAHKTEITRKPAPDAPALRLRVQDRSPTRTPAASALFRVYSGHAQVRHARCTTPPATCPSAWARLELLQGKTQTPVPEIQAGDIGAVAKLKETQTGDTLCDKAHPIVYPPRRLPRAGHHLRHRAQDARRRGQDLRRAAPPDGGGPGPEALARRADPRDAALGHGPAPHRGGGRRGCASATRSRSTSRSRRSPTGRRSRARPRATAATRSRPAATASSATARSA